MQTQNGPSGSDHPLNWTFDGSSGIGLARPSRRDLGSVLKPSHVPASVWGACGASELGLSARASIALLLDAVRETVHSARHTHSQWRKTFGL